VNWQWFNRHADNDIIIRALINWGPAGLIKTDSTSSYKIMGQGELQIELRGSDPNTGYSPSLHGVYATHLIFHLSVHLLDKLMFLKFFES
jgi:hypothetical protein